MPVQRTKKQDSYIMLDQVLLDIKDSIQDQKTKAKIDLAELLLFKLVKTLEI